MTEATAQRSAADPVATTLELPESLAQENAQLRRQLADLNARMDQLVDERLAEWVTLQESDLQIHARLDAEHVLNAVLDWVMLVTSAVAGALYLIVMPQEPKTLRAVAQRGYWPEMDLNEPLQWPTGQDILARALDTGQAVQQAHVCQEGTLRPQHDADRSHLAIPIRHQQQALGLFALESAFADGFTAAQIDSATRLADHAALAIQNALRYQKVSQRLEGLLAVYQSSLNLTSCLAPDKLPLAVVHNAREYLHADRAALYQYDSTADSWSLAAALNRDATRPTVADPSEQALIETAALDKTAQFARDPTGGDVAALPLSTADPPANTVQLDQQILGILLLAFKSGSSPLLEERETLYLYAGQAAIALKNAQQIAHLERAAQHRQERTSYITRESKAPLTAIQGYARLMLQQIGGDITGQQREFLETILKNTSQLETLLDKQLGS